ncbi:MAG: DNRLRE domain-containing protein [Anaerolineae bacterium]
MKPRMFALLLVLGLLGLGAASVVAPFYLNARLDGVNTFADSLPSGETLVYLPLVMRGACALEDLPYINAPRFSGSIPFDQTAIAWFGRVSPVQNYADIRVGYNTDELYIYLAIFDRHLWYDENPMPHTLTDWDAVTLLLDTTDGYSTSLCPYSPTCWRFVAQLYSEPSIERRSAYRGGGSGWQTVSIPFQATPGWRGNALNDNSDSDRGWAMGFTLPFSSLSLSSAPAMGTTWRMAVLLHDRDARAGPSVGDQSWPPIAALGNPACWGFLRFGIPAYAAIGPATGHTLIRRPTQNSSLVPDADVGSTIANQCPGDEYHIWNDWGNRNDGHAPDFNIQNQSDVADWPCFAKYYVTFPLDSIPPGSVIISATLTLHQFGNAGGPGEAQPSWIQVLVAAGDWNEATITWNNAPLAYENVGGRWVNPLVDWSGWPGTPRTWNVSYAVARAYAQGEPLRLVLYSADSAYHSGKYFVSSDTEDWNEAGRPRLDVWWRQP